MKQLLIVIITMVFMNISYGQNNKATINLDQHGYSRSGAISDYHFINYYLKDEVKVEIRKDDLFDRKELSLTEKISVLEAILSFYKFLVKNGLNPDKQITGVYKDTNLKEVLEKLFPNAHLTFDGVEETVTIKNMTANKASLELVCKFLGLAAGVYIYFTDDGVIISAKPREALNN